MERYLLMSNYTVRDLPIRNLPLKDGNVKGHGCHEAGVRLGENATNWIEIDLAVYWL